MKNQSSSKTTTLFVSRRLEKESPILVFCEQRSIQVIHESLLSFSAVAFDALPHGEWLFFYSRSGVHFLLQQISDLKTIRQYKIACYGPSTAKAWEAATSIAVSFTGDGKPINVPAKFKEVIEAHESVVFVRAMHSKMAVQRAIEHEVDCQDVIAYKNSRRDDIAISNQIDYAMLTSPMNADAFLEALPSYTGPIITLGTTTSSHLMTQYNIPSVAADLITEMGMLEKLKLMLVG